MPQLGGIIRPLLLLMLLTIAGCFAHSDDVAWCQISEPEPFARALDYDHSQHLNQSVLQKLLDDTLQRFPCQMQIASSNNTCNEMLSAAKIYELLQLTSDAELNSGLLRRASIAVVSYLYGLTFDCQKDANNKTWTSLDEEGHVDRLLEIPDGHGHEEDEHEHHGNATEEDDGHGHHGEGESMSADQLETLLRTIAKNYISGDWRNIGETFGCGEDGIEGASVGDLQCNFGLTKSFNSRKLLQLVNLKTNATGGEISRDQLGEMSALLFMKLLSGECITEVNEEADVTSDDYIDSIFNGFGDHDHCEISKDEFGRLLDLLKNGTKQNSTDEHKEEDPHGHDGHSHRRRKRHVGGQEHDHPKTEADNVCLSLDAILTSFGMNSTESAVSISKTDFYRLCPAIVQQVAIGCKSNSSTKPTDQMPIKKAQASTAETYGYGTLAVLIISLCVVFALIVVRWKGTVVYRYLITTMLGLAVGSLVGDALLHLIPMSLGAHDDHSHEGEGGGPIVVEPYVWKALASCGSVWFYYNLQLFLYKAGSIAGFLRRALGLRSRSRSSSSPSDLYAVNDGYSSNATLSDFHRRSSDDDGSMTSSQHDNRGNGNKGNKDNDAKRTIIADGDDEEQQRHKEERRQKQNKEQGHQHFDDVAHTHSSVAWMITIGDAIHNFADGLAMGGAFSIDWQTGLSTTIAIFTHELPHEFGDTAVLLAAGWSTKKVLLFQLLSQLTAFIGLYIGISVSETTDGAQNWIAAVAAGMFLYIALADVIPELVHFFSLYSPFLIFLTSNLGICIGFLSMVLLAVYEERIAI